MKSVTAHEWVLYPVASFRCSMNLDRFASARRLLMLAVAGCILVSPASAKERVPGPSFLQIVARTEAVVTGKIVELQSESIVLELEHVHPAVVAAGERI